VDDKIPYSTEFDKTTNLKQGSLIQKDQVSQKSKDAQSRYSQRAGSTLPAKRGLEPLENSRNLFGTARVENKKDLSHLADFLKSQTATLSAQKPSTPLTASDPKWNTIGLSQLKLNRKLQNKEATDLVFLNNRHRHVNNFDGRQLLTQPSPDDRFSRSALCTAQALTRKKISLSYHTQMPAFMRADGPFHIYDHALRYPTVNQQTDCDKVTANALARYEHQITDLQR